MSSPHGGRPPDNIEIDQSDSFQSQSSTQSSYSNQKSHYSGSPGMSLHSFKPPSNISPIPLTPLIDKFRVRQYPIQCPGPFVVYIRKTNENAKLDIIKINQMLMRKYEKINIIRPVSKKKLKMQNYSRHMIKISHLSMYIFPP